MSTVTRVSHATTGWGKWITITLIFGVFAFLTSPGAPFGGFWGKPAVNLEPSGVQIMGLMILGVIQSLAFGLGIAFLLFGFPLLNTRKLVSQPLARATHLAIAWSLANWWPHTNFHMTANPNNINGLLAIEYGFHVTLILAGLIIAFFFVTLLRQG